MKNIVLAGTKKEPDEIELANRALARRAAAEGFVLLENDGTLPLQTKKVALYGSGARRTVKGGTGSGAVRERYSVSIEEGLRNAGIEISTAGWLDRFDAFYEETYAAYRREAEEAVKGMSDFYQILRTVKDHTYLYPTGVPVTEDDYLKDRREGVDTAIYVLTRQAGEGLDRKNIPGDYRPDATELSNLKIISGQYRHLIVVVNVGGMMDLSFLDEIRFSALVYFAQGGEEGGNALADVLTGKQNFSGKLTGTWAEDYNDYPGSGGYSYAGKDPHQQDYVEGIYVGYRYFDTFGVKPKYSFGYGLSYTTFDIHPESLAQDGRTLVSEVTVRNTGSVQGAEVVQIYVSVPEGSAGAEAKRLVGFARTSELGPGREEKLTISFPVDALTKYDEKSSSYVLEKGEYILWAGNTSTGNPQDRRPSERLAAAALITVSEDVITEKCTPVCPLRKSLPLLTPDGSAARQKAVPEMQASVPVRLTLNPAYICTLGHSGKAPEPKPDPIVSVMSEDQLVRTVVGGGTHGKDSVVLAIGASGTTSGSLYEELGIPNVVLSDGPAGLNLTPQIVELPDGTYKAARVPEVLKVYERYMFGAAGAGMKAQMAAPSDGILHYQYATAWPCSQLLAQSWDRDLLCSVGDGIGKEMEKFGVTVWLGPGMNIQRNPLCGRAFEYYSEDPVLSGTLAAAVVSGVQSHPGKGCSVKHFVCNNCEWNRNYSSSNVTERALREIYLKGFEIAVKTSSPMTVMASYNMVNGTYVNNSYDLLVKVLRDEWGFQGLVVSDWDSMKADPKDPLKPVSGDVLKAPAAQCDLIMPGRPDQITALKEGLTDGTVRREDLQRSAARILAVVRQNTAAAVRGGHADAAGTEQPER